jgi:tape measure domain-containing protein
MATLEVLIDGRGATTGGEQVVRSLDSINRATRQTERGFDKQTQATQRNTRASRENATAITTLKNVFQGLAGAFAVREFIRLSDQYTEFQNRIRLASDSQVEFNALQAEVIGLAQDLRQPLNETARLFGRISAVSDDLGVSQREVLDITRTVGQTLAISGVSAQQAGGALLQFSQALAGGIVRAEEFNSITEGTPRLQQAIADGLGVTRGELRKLVVDGRLTSRELARAIQSQADVIQSEVGDIDVTFGAAFTTLRNFSTVVVGAFNDAAGVSEGLVEVFNLTGDETLNLRREIIELSLAFREFVQVATVAVANTIERVPNTFATVANRVRGTFATILGDEASAEFLSVTASGIAQRQTEIQNRLTQSFDAIAAEAAARRAELLAGLDEAGAAADPSFGRLAGSQVEIATVSDDIVGDINDVIEANLTARETFEQQLQTLNELREAARIAGIDFEETFTRAVKGNAAAFLEADPAVQAWNDRVARAAEITQSARTATEEYSDGVRELVGLFNDGLITQETLNRGIEDLRDTLFEVEEVTNEFAVQAARNIQSAFANFLFDPIDQGLAGLARSITSTLLSIASEIIASQALTALFGILPGGLGGALLSGLPGRQFGGRLQTGQSAIVGENGPEIITPPQPVSVFNTQQVQAAAPNVNMPVRIVNVQDPNDTVAALTTGAGERAILNVIRTNRESIRRELG